MLTGLIRRRRWSAEEKARIVEEILAPEAGMPEVARRGKVCCVRLATCSLSGCDACGPNDDSRSSAPRFVPIMTGVPVQRATPPSAAPSDRGQAGRLQRYAYAFRPARCGPADRGINVPAGAFCWRFRKGAHGLALAQEVLTEGPFSGTVTVYRSKRSDRLKILV
jgi:hypothetical protein